jgi:hypothetical protein
MKRVNPEISDVYVESASILPLFALSSLLRLLPRSLFDLLTGTPHNVHG